MSILLRSRKAQSRAGRGNTISLDREMTAIPQRSESKERRTWMEIYLMGWFGIRRQKFLLAVILLLFSENVGFTK